MNRLLSVLIDEHTPERFGLGVEEDVAVYVGVAVEVLEPVAERVPVTVWLAVPDLLPVLVAVPVELAVLVAVLLFEAVDVGVPVRDGV